MTLLRRKSKSKLPRVVQQPEPRPPDGELVELHPHFSAEAAAEVDARYADANPLPEDREPDGALTVHTPPAGAAGTPIGGITTDYPSDEPQPIVLSEASREAIEHQRASEKPTEPPKTSGEITTFRPTGPGADTTPLGVRDERRSD